MKRLLYLLLFLPLLFSCEPSSVREGRKVYKAYFKKKLIDPESFIVYGEKYEITNDVRVEWTLDYGAKNRGGGMNRHEIKFTTVGTSLWIDGWSYSLEDLE